MPSVVKMYPYSMASESGKDLARLMDIKRVRPEGTYVPRVGHSVINWGSGRTPNWLSHAERRGVHILNPISKVSVASNKLKALIALRAAGIATPEFTTSRSTAEEWVRSGATVIERHELRGNSGEGIRVVNLNDENVSNMVSTAPLYTKFIAKTAEFRVHVFNGAVIDYCEKKKVSRERRPDNFNKYVCSTEVGWVFARTNVRDIPEVKRLAIAAVRALGLDFGAVDVVYFEGRPYVLEVNTAPGLAGTTLIRYANAFRQFMGAPNLSAETEERLLSQVQRRTTQSSHAATFEASDMDDGSVTLTLDRETALKLKSILDGLV